MDFCLIQEHNQQRNDDLTSELKLFRENLLQKMKYTTDPHRYSEDVTIWANDLLEHLRSQHESTKQSHHHRLNLENGENGQSSNHNNFMTKQESDENDGPVNEDCEETTPPLDDRAFA